MDHTLDAALNQLWERTSWAIENAQRKARLVERLEEETKKLKELTDSFNEKRMQDEKEIEEMRLREEILEREEQEQKNSGARGTGAEEAKMQQEEEKRKKRRLGEEDDEALSAFMLEQYGKVKIYLDSGDFYWGYHHPPRGEGLLSRTRRKAR